MKKNKNLLKGLLIAISIFIILFLLLASTFNIRTTSISRTISKMFLGTDIANVVKTWNGFYDSTGKFYNITATLYDDGTFIFSGNGKMQEYDSERHCQWYSYSDSIKNVRIESGITNIGSYAFAYCSNLTSIEIASSVTTIGTKAFAECSSLRSINIPSNVKSIGDYAFQNCSSLINAKIPSTVTSIGDDVFEGCKSLEEIIVDESNKTYISLDGVLFNKNKTKIIKYPSSKRGEIYEIPSTVTSIEDSAFENCTNLRKVIIPSTVTSIGYYAFYGCSNLTTINIPEGITSIQFSTFENCSNLTDIVMPSTLTSIGSSAFKNCDNLTNIELPDAVRSIDSSAFEDCDNLTNIELPDTMTSIGSSAFKGCSSLESIEIPEGVKSLGYWVFEDCSNLTSITIPSSITSINDTAFDGCENIEEIIIDENNTIYSSEDGVLFNKDKTELIKCPVSKETYIIPSSVKTIKSDAFERCILLTSVKIPDSVTSIGSSAFYGCNSLKSIKIPSGVTTINSLTFAECSSLSNVEISNGVTNIEQSAFRKCISLTSIEIPASVTTIAAAFDGCEKIEKIVVNGNNTNYTSVDGVLFSKDKTELVRYPEGKKGEKYEISSTVTTIDGSAFRNCINLISIEIPDSVTTINYGAFNNCTNLSNVTVKCNSYARSYMEENYDYVLNIEHITSIYVSTIPPTCTEQGYTTYTCTCGENFKTDIIEAIGHSIKNYVSNKDATCTEDGTKTAICDNGCGTTDTRIDEGSAGHKYSEEWTIDIEATCIEKGSKSYHCTRCEVKTEITEVPELGHNYEEKITLPTCTEQGYTTHTCTRCSDSYIDTYVDALGHTEVIDRPVEATCTETGLTEGKHCAVCNEILIAQEIVPELGHDYEDKATLPTCTEQGYTTHTCTRCSDSYVDKYVDELGHTEVVDEAKDPTCTETGLTEGKHCSVCNEVLKAQEIVPELGHDYEDRVTLPTCTEQGYTTHTCTRCSDSYVDKYVDELGHTEVVDEAKDPTCTETGLTEGKHCSVCNEVLKAQEIVPELGHDYKEEITAPTCTQKGYTTHTCTRCSDSYIDTYVDALGHTEVIDRAVEATCTETGLTEGEHCSVCNEVLVAQNVVPVNGHTEVIDEAVSPTCTETGLTEGKHCSVCNEVLVKQEVVEALGHTEVIDEAVLPTCTETGLTEGKHCSVCKEVLVKQEEVPALGHDKQEHEGKAATCTEKGWKAYVTCSRCNYTTYEEIEKLGHDYSEEWTIDVEATCTEVGSKSHHCTRCEEKTEIIEIPAKGHTEVKDEAVSPTCTETGLTEGKHCSVCNEVVAKQEVVEALGHTEAKDEAVSPTCTETGLTEGKHCSVCNEVLAAQEVVNALGHDYEKEIITPTCTEKGYTTHTCTRCSENYVDTYVNEIGHNIGEWVIEKEATTTEEGLKYRVCTNCGSEREEEIIPIKPVAEWEIPGEEGTNIKVNVYEDGTLKIEGEGELPEYTEETVPWKEKQEEITKVEIGEGITNIGKDTFDGCTNLEEIIVDKDNPNYSSKDGVLFNKDGSELIKYPEGKKDESYEVPEGVTTIGKEAFEGNEYITSITIPKEVENIGENAFDGCTNLEEIIVDENNPNYSSKDGVLFDKDGTELIKYPEGKKDETYEIPEIVTTIRKEAFEGNNHVTEVTMPENVENIGENAFNGCEKLTTIKVKCTTYAESHIKENYNYEVKVEHEYSEEWTIDKETTCTEVGSKSHYCTRCEDKTDITEIPALGHDYKEEITDPTCTEEGYTTHTCTRCSDSYIDTYVEALGHTEVVDEAVNPTCTETGLTEGKHCSECNEVLIAQEIVPELGHDYEEEIIAPTCTEKGYTTHTCTRCSDSYVDTYVDALGHTEVIDEAKEPICTETGLTEGKHCAVCKEVLVAQEEVPALGHDKQEHERKEATCEEKGWKAYETCSRCNYTTYEEIPELGHDYKEEITDPTCTEKGYTTHTCARCSDSYIDTYVDALGHKEVVDSAVAATCTETGLTEGKHCSVCNEVLAAQEVVNALGHDYEDKVTLPTCTEKGYTTHTCTRCSDSYVDTYVDALGHTEVIDKAKEPTCTETGLTEGKYCSVCNEVLVAQEIVPELGHDYKEEITVPTCTEQGYTTHTCTRCSDSYINEYVDELGHREIVDEAVAATCTETGLTEGKYCSICNVVLVVQEVVDALGHIEVIDSEVVPTCIETGLTEGKYCSVCNEVLVAQEEIPALGHIEVIDEARVPTCTKIGLTEGKHCSACKKEIVAQKLIAATGHYMGEWIIDREPTHEEEGHKYRVCINCNVEREDEDIPKLVNTEVEIITTYMVKEHNNEKFLIMDKVEQVDKVLNNIISDKELTIIDRNGNKLDQNEKAGTGSKVIIKESEKAVYTISLKGDVNGDAEVTPVDVTMSNSIRLRKIEFNMENLFAADINGNGKVEPIEITIINGIRLGKVRI